MNKNPSESLKSWYYKLAIISGLLFPTVTAIGAFYNIKVEMAKSNGANSDRIATLELQNQKTFADKESQKEMQKDIKQMREDIVEIKTLLIRKFK